MEEQDDFGHTLNNSDSLLSKPHVPMRVFMGELDVRPMPGFPNLFVMQMTPELRDAEERLRSVCFCSEPTLTSATPQIDKNRPFDEV